MRIRRVHNDKIVLADYFTAPDKSLLGEANINRFVSIANI